MEKRDTITSLNTELSRNYRSLKLVQDNTDVKGLDKNGEVINALKREMPWNNNLTDIELFLDFLKNQPVDQQISVECWNRLQSQIAKYPDKYTIYEDLYTVIERLIRFSKILTGEITTNNPVDKPMFKQLSVIRINSEEYIQKYKKHFLKG